MVDKKKTGARGRRKVSMCARCTRKCKQLPFVDTLSCPSFKPRKKAGDKKPLGKRDRRPPFTISVSRELHE